MSSRQEQAFALIWQHWQAGTVMGGLPPDLKPQTRAEGYAIQAHLETQSPKPLAGWKIAATSLAGQRHIGVDGPIAGRLLAEFLHPDHATVSIAHNRMRVAEPEFAFRFAHGLAPRPEPYSVDEVMAAVGSLHLAIELPDSRYADFAKAGGPSLIAEAACARDLVVGRPVHADWRALDLAKHAVTGIVQGRYARDGSGGNVLGDPRVALAWLVNELSGLGIPVKANELVTTGASVPPLEIEPGDHVVADLGPLGSVRVTVAGPVL
jgi:2-keto-4-pentenoate hydratase